MIPSQTFDEYPVFADAGTKIKPDDAKYSQGFLPADVLPAEWHNYFLNGATKGITALNAGLTSVEQEINSVLTDRKITPNQSLTNQLLSALQSFRNEAVLAAHPIGSIYITSKSENPAVTFGGGTWVQIKDKFILAAGDTYKNAATGGNATVTLTVAQLPSHNHSYTPSGSVSAHSHGLNSHTHAMAHTHSVTASGSISGGAYTFSGTAGTTVENGNHTHDIGLINTVTSQLYSFNTGQFGNWGNKNTEQLIGAGSSIGTTGWYKQIAKSSGSHTHSFTPNGSVSVKTNPTFTGSAVTSGESSAANTGAASGNTANATPTFTGTAGNTNSTGSGNSINIMPPYVVKYVWERTA